MFSSLEDYLPEYAESEHFLFLAPEAKEHAEAALAAFCARVAERGGRTAGEVTPKLVEAALLQDMGRLALPPAARRAVPEMLQGFFAFLRETGRYPAAGALELCAEALAPKYRAALRDDGTVKGETYRKASSEVGRNDPCFCGSGLKYKKCCGA